MNTTVTTVAKRFTPILGLLLLSACGGDGSTSSPTVITVPPFTAAPVPVPPPPPPPPSPPTDLIATPAGTSCVSERDPDVLGEVFETVNTVQSQPHGCLIVNSTDKQPVFDGLRSARFEVRPEDCGASVGYSDCTNDRSRHEISEKEGASTSGQVITWEENIYIPKQTRFRPRGDRNALFITQINFKNKADYGTLAYLEIGENGSLLVRTHKDFTWDIKTRHVIANSFPVDTWTNIKFEVLSTPQSNGYIRVYLNGKLVVEEIRQTLPTAEHSNMMRFGIYNAFKSLAFEPYTTQVMYFDGVKKSVRFN